MDFYNSEVEIGILQKQVEFDKAIDKLSCYDESFEAIIDKIYVENIDSYVENIDSNDNSTIELSFELE